jgi:glycosyltransferase involved in cell wall biosynthesis
MLGRTTDRYESLVRMAKENNIEVMGELPNDKVNNLLSQSHILVNTSQSEGFSNTFIQAWMRKVPVVSLQVDPDHIIEREGIGFCCTGNFEKLAGNTKRLIKDHELREQMGRKAREYAVQHHSLKNMELIIKVFDKLLPRTYAK